MCGNNVCHWHIYCTSTGHFGYILLNCREILYVNPIWKSSTPNLPRLNFSLLSINLGLLNYPERCFSTHNISRKYKKIWKKSLKEDSIACPSLSWIFFLTNVSMTTHSLFPNYAVLLYMDSRNIACHHFPIRQFLLPKTILMHSQYGY